MGTKNESLRQRKGRGNDRSTHVKNVSEEPSTNASSSLPPETGTTETTTTTSCSSYWSVIKRHPLTYVVLLVGIPYLGWVGYRWIKLQHPLHPTWRPAVQQNDPRQLLILGTMSSGTSSMAHYLSRISPTLEIGHEDSDTSWKFVRDGTVSWFHGIRYWKVQDEEHRQKMIAQLCKVQWMMYSMNSFNDNYGFGPTLFGTPEYNCSWWQQAPSIPMSCYRHACEKALQRELACGIPTTFTNGKINHQENQDPDHSSTATTTSTSTCTTPYQTTLVQTREPWMIVTSLTAKYCLEESTSPATLHFRDHLPKTLYWLLLALQIPSHSCVVQLIDYVVLYYQNVASLPRYKVESLPTDPILAACIVLQLAGLDQWNTTVYKPNHDMYMNNCVLAQSQQQEQKQQQPASSLWISQSPVKKNVINQGRVRLEDILPIVPEESIVKMKQLYHLLDYEYPQVSSSSSSPSSLLFEP